ncbi:UvrD-helicase domain-containing protein [Micromonospora sp. NPDC049645]|uniref:UvrD-helicase domain-containing protein n=1 Tax=Micromonospora sp. NPDC049645 TaxID=3155508 RepID=UPI0034400CF1
MTYEPRGTQYDVITSSAPVIVVRGGAGTGKTTTAVAAARAYLEMADRHLLETRRLAAIADQRTRLAAPQRVLFLSFSRTAVTQIIDRAGSIIGPYGPRLEVATFDGFAWRIVTSFGPYHGYPPPLSVLSVANARVPGAPPGLTYDELLPAAMKLLALPRIAEHYNGRYGMIICDEFQDTDVEEWAFLRTIAPSARLILLGDLHQCIYDGFKHVDPNSRISDALALPGAIEIELPPASFRDPTGVLPAAAEAARERRFDDPAIAYAAKAGRLSITRTTSATGYAEVIDLARNARLQGHTVSIFTHTNAATTELSDAMRQAGLNHEQVGLTEAYGEALPAQLALIQYALGDDAAPIRRALAVYITANHRGKYLPALAEQLLSGTNPQLEHALSGLCQDLRAGAGSAPDLADLSGVIAGAYRRVGTFRGQETWTQAAERTRNALRGANLDHGMAGIEAQLLRLRDESLVGGLSPRRHSIQAMNLHQTKGREADTTILLLRPDEWYGYEQDPYPNGSRLLYVVMTRARQRAHLVVPSAAHPLWQPLVDACDSSRTGTRLHPQRTGVAEPEFT